MEFEPNKEMKIMSNRQLAAVIARRKAAQGKKTSRPNPMLVACIEAAGFNEHRSY